MMPALRVAVLLVLDFAAGQWFSGNDWIINPPNIPTQLVNLPGGQISLTNGIIARTFATTPNFATVDFRLLSNVANPLSGKTYFRGLAPEAVLTLGVGAGVNVSVGGLVGQQHFAYFDPSLWNITNDPKAFVMVHYATSPPIPQFHWEQQRHAEPHDWPPKGLRLTVTYAPPANSIFTGLTVRVVYEMYDNLPVLSKWVEVQPAEGTDGIFIGYMAIEQLRVPEHQQERLGVFSDYMPRHTDAWANLGPMEYDLNTNVWWNDDTYQGGPDGTPSCEQGDTRWQNLLLNISYPLGPSAMVKPNQTFTSFRAFLIAFDSDDEERQTLTVRKMVRTLAPQITENPIYFYLSDINYLRPVIDQCAATGFEMVIMGFGSGYDPLDVAPLNIIKRRLDYEYAHEQGILIGGYTLMQNPPNLNSSTEAIFNGEPMGIACFATDFHEQYRDTLVEYITKTGQDMVETDGPYEGMPCESQSHTYHLGLGDSQWEQDLATADFYRGLKEMNIFITAPDPYYLNAGTNREPMGYTDFYQDNMDNVWEYLTTGRMYAYDGTFYKPPTQGWMMFDMGFIYPNISQNLEVYDWALASYLGQGIVSCYVGNQVFDGPASQALVASWVAFYKAHRQIITSDLIHVMRPDGRDAELMVHVNIAGTERAMGTFFNPAPTPYNETVAVPLYYTGLTAGTVVNVQWGASAARPLFNQTSTLDARCFIYLSPTLAPKSYKWFIVTVAHAS